jgi:hypothetical protein
MKVTSSERGIPKANEAAFPTNRAQLRAPQTFNLREALHFNVRGVGGGTPTRGAAPCRLSAPQGITASEIADLRRPPSAANWR